MREADTIDMAGTPVRETTRKTSVLGLAESAEEPVTRRKSGPKGIEFAEFRQCYIDFIKQEPDVMPLPREWHAAISALRRELGRADLLAVHLMLERLPPQVRAGERGARGASLRSCDEACACICGR